MVGRTRTGLIWLMIGKSGASWCDHGHEILYLLTPWSRVVLENLTGSQLVKKSPPPPPMKLEGSLPRLQMPVTCPCPEPDQPSPCPSSHFLKSHLNIIPTSTPGSSNHVYASPLPRRMNLQIP
jgi:hypothetical protein